MKEYRILTENEKIEAILQSFEDSIMGQGIKLTCDYKIEYGENSSTLVLTPKEGKDITAAEFFTFGLIIGRDYLNEDIRIKTEKLEKAIQIVKRAVSSLD